MDFHCAAHVVRLPFQMSPRGYPLVSISRRLPLYPDDERRAPARVRERQMNAMRMGGATRDINAVAGGRRIRRSRYRAGRFPASRRTAAPSEVQGGALGRACLLH